MYEMYIIQLEYNSVYFTAHGQYILEVSKKKCH